MLTGRTGMGVVVRRVASSISIFGLMILAGCSPNLIGNLGNEVAAHSLPGIAATGAMPTSKKDLPRLSGGTPTVVLAMGATSFTLSNAPVSSVQVNCGTACGLVDFRVDGTEWGTVPLDASGMFVTNSFPTVGMGSHTLQVFYLGNANYATAASNIVNFTVLSAGSTVPTVTLTMAATSFILGSTPITSVQVSCGTACGDVDFHIDGQEWGTVPLNSGGAFVTNLPTLSAGSHTVQAFYLGSASYAATPSSVLNITVTTPGSTVPTVVLTMSSVSFPLNSAPAVNVQVSCGTACGLADFRIDGAEWGTVAVNTSGAFLTNLPTVAVGSHKLQVFYLGNGTYSAASSNAINFTVLSAGSTIPTVALNMSTTSFTQNSAPTSSVQVSCASACGQVDFRVDGAEWAIVPLNAIGAFVTNALPTAAVGSHTLQVFYLGNGSYSTAASNVINFTVAATGSTAPTVVLTMASTSFALNSTPATSVQVSCGTACGNVDFRIDGAEWGTVPLNGSGAFATSLPVLAVGSHTVQVFYLGNASYSATPSNVVAVTAQSGLPAGTPAFSVPGGTYTSTQAVAITDTTSGAAIYYTTDTTTPTTSSTRYTVPLSVASSQTIKAIAVASGYNTSSVGSAVYTINLAPSITVNGGGQVRLGATAQFAATVTGETNTSVTWQVNGTTGGSSTVGTISTAGLYTAPAVVPSPNTVTITAVSVASSTVKGTASEVVLDSLPVLTSATVTVNPGAATGLLDVIGTGFVSGSQLQAAGTTMATTFLSSTELQATIPVAAGTTTVAVDAVNPDPGGATSSMTNAPVTFLNATLQSAARLLDQGTFGPTLTDIQHVETVGLQGYLNEQFSTTITPPTLEPDIAAIPPTLCATNLIPCQQSEWWQAALTGPDQLRQRVAFALSSMFVISTNSVNARSVTAFQNILVKDAFANFSTIMKDVTLSPGMGLYLNMLNSAKPATVNGVPQIANENYSRELMQLFTTGIDMLNQDASLQLDGSGNPIPVYTEAQVQAFARAYTGWTYGQAGGVALTKYPNSTADYDDPMQAYEAQHDMLAKTLLNGTTLPAGQTAEADLAAALTNIFNHTNVGPFVCRQLIQHLVTSNPSPAYVARISAVFANDGNGVRGNMQAVVQAILMDTEARAGDTNSSYDGGHLRESMLYMTNMLRGLGFTNNDAVAGNDVVANASYNTLSNYTSPLGEKPYTSGSVFNFFPPNYVIPDSTTNAPEFGQENTASAVLRLTLANTVVYNGISGFTVNLGATSALGLIASKTGNATTDSTNLVSALNTMFMHGQMPSQMQTDIVNHVATILNNPAERVRVATYLVITSSFYKVEH